MSEELAQDDADAEDYDMEALERRHRDDDDNATLVGGPRGSERLAEDRSFISLTFSNKLNHPLVLFLKLGTKTTMTSPLQKQAKSLPVCPGSRKD